MPGPPTVERRLAEGLAVVGVDHAEADLVLRPVGEEAGVAAAEGEFVLEGIAVAGRADEFGKQVEPAARVDFAVDAVGMVDRFLGDAVDVDVLAIFLVRGRVEIGFALVEVDADLVGAVVDRVRLLVADLERLGDAVLEVVIIIDAVRVGPVGLLPPSEVKTPALT